MPNPLLSSYRAGENRVTSSTMAVFERIDLALVQELLSAAIGAGLELRTVSFENQVVSDGAVPDARISARFTWLFETKTVRGGYAAEGHNRQQLRQHATQLHGDPDARLFVLTPDPARPAWFDELDGIDQQVRDQVLWLSFKDIADAVATVIENPARLVGEQTKFLLAELVALYETDGLLTNDDTVIVAARSAWPEYQAISAYVCQPDRAFRQGLTHFGFYAGAAIQPLVARIRAHHTSVPFTRDEVASRRAAGDVELADLVERQLNDGPRTEGNAHGVVLLSGPDDEDTIDLERVIVNDTKTASGRPWAWTLSQRYTRLDRLRSKDVTRTSDL
jgi:hypothetical protein